MKKISIATAILVSTVPFSVNAGLITSVFDSNWTDITVGSGEDVSDNSGSNVKVNPGWGGQAFDAEYLLYKIDGDKLSIGLQTGFDILDGHQGHTDNRDYYAGDIALSFNGLDGSALEYEFAIDFGNVTMSWGDNPDKAYGYDPENVGLVDGNQDLKGIYEVAEWNNDIYFDESSPFAMDEGEYKQDISLVGNQVGNSYYQIATFNISNLLSSSYDITRIDAQWTMSCGNDAVYGKTDIPPTSVPEPSSIALLSTGLIGLFGGLNARRKRIKK